jgi:hypothetical protein
MTYREQDDAIMRTDSTFKRWPVPEALGLVAPPPPADVVSERCVESPPERVDEPEVVLLDPLREDVALAPDSRRPVISTW